MTMPESPYQPPRGVPLREAHAHVVQHGLSMRMLGLEGCESGGEMLGLIAERAATEASGRPLLGGGARPEGWPAGPHGSPWPPLALLDEITGERPCCVWCFDYHALMANTAALRLAGIDEGARDRLGGIIGRDDDGGLNGVVYEHAALEVWEALVNTGGQEAQHGAMADLIDAMISLEAHGFAEIHDLKSQAWLGPMLAGVLGEHRALNARYVLWPLIDDLAGVHASRGGWESERVRLGGGKIFVDGTLNSRTAWMLHPYADADTAGRPGKPCGMAMMTPGQIEDAVRRCDALGLPMAAHAIGDAAVRAVLDAIERVKPKTSGFRIEHAELVDEADVRRFAELGVICSVQPCHVLYDIEALGRAVPDRLDRVLPLRSLIDSGCAPGELMIFGSDTPIVRPDPGDSVQAAVERCRVGGDAAIGLGERISEGEAWACFKPSSC